jgi:hypothetical protein
MHGPVQVYGWHDQTIGNTVLNSFTINFEAHYKYYPICSAKIVGSSDVHVMLPAIPYTSWKEFEVLHATLWVRNQFHDGLANAEIYHLNDMNDSKTDHSKTKVIVLKFPCVLSNMVFSPGASDGTITKVPVPVKHHTFKFGSMNEDVGWNPCQVKWFVSVHEDKK